MFKPKIFLFTLFVCLSVQRLSAQVLQDSLVNLYNNYLNLTKQTNRLDSMNGVISSLQTQYHNFDAVLRSSNESLKRITNAQLFSR